MKHCGDVQITFALRYITTTPFSKSFTLINAKVKGMKNSILLLIVGCVSVKSPDPFPDPDDQYKYDRGEQQANRVCPEFGGTFSRVAYPAGPEAACVVEGDILCPHFRPSLCIDQLENCTAADGERRLRKTYPVKGFFQPEMFSYDYRYLIDVHIDPTFGKSSVQKIVEAHRFLEDKICVSHFFVRGSSSDDPVSFRPYIRWIRSGCICAVDGLGLPTKKQFLEEGVAPYRAIYMPDENDDYTPFALKAVYPSSNAARPTNRKTHVGAEGKDRVQFNTCTYQMMNKIHFILHAYGIGHETNRPDRDSWVHVNKRQIMRDTGNGIELQRFFYTDNWKLPYFAKYDKNKFTANSIMAYDPYDWNMLRDIPVITPVVQDIHPAAFGNRQFLDADELNQLRAVFGHVSARNSTCPYKKPPTFRRSRKGCEDPGHAPTTLRLGNKLHFGARVQYECEIEDGYMLGSSSRLCLRSADWSGYKPACVDRKSVHLHCTPSKMSKRCKFLNSQSHDHVEGLHTPAGRVKRKVPRATHSEESFKETYTTPLFRPKSDKVCVHFYYRFGRSVPVEVLLIRQSGSKSTVWKDVSTNNVFKEHMVLFETGIPNLNETYQVELRGTDLTSENPLPFVVNFVAVIDGKCYKI